MAERVTFLAQYKDWSGEWRDDGRVFASAREARDECIADLSGLGCSGADVRVLRRGLREYLEVIDSSTIDRFAHQQADEDGCTRYVVAGYLRASADRIEAGE